MLIKKFDKNNYLDALGGDKTTFFTLAKLLSSKGLSNVQGKIMLQIRIT